MIAHAMYEPLLTFEGGDMSKPVPLIAESYELSEDGKTLTLPLRTDVTFSDGTKLTSADVVFSYNRTKNLATRRSSSRASPRRHPTTRPSC